MDDVVDHFAVNRGKQGIIFSLANVRAGVNTRTALAHQDIPGEDDLTGKLLNAQRWALLSRPLRLEPPPFL
jgi:hypothetical protein